MLKASGRKNRAFEPRRVFPKVDKLNENDVELIGFLADFKNWRLPAITDTTAFLRKHRNMVLFQLEKIKRLKDDPAIPQHLREKL